jgi:hypothetical protein
VCGGVSVWEGLGLCLDTHTYVHRCNVCILQLRVQQPIRAPSNSRSRRSRCNIRQQSTHTHTHTHTAGGQGHVLLRTFQCMEASCNIWPLASWPKRNHGWPHDTHLCIHGQTAIFSANELAGLDPLEDHHATFEYPPLFPLHRQTTFSLVVKWREQKQRNHTTSEETGKNGVVAKRSHDSRISSVYAL